MSVFSNIYYNLAGQKVDISHPDLASGIYYASDQAVGDMNIEGTNCCAPGTRPVKVRIKGLPASNQNPEGFINGCQNITTQIDLPDVHVVDWKYRIYMDMLLAGLIVVLTGAIVVKVFK